MIEKETQKNQTSPVTPALQPARSATPASFRGGARPGAGRPRGVPNKVTQAFRDVLLRAVSEVGSSREVSKDGGDGLLAYLKVAAVKQENTTLMLLGRILPLKITTEVKETKETMTIEEAVADLKAAGMEPMLALYLQKFPLERDDEDAEWAKMIDVSLAPDPLADTVALEKSVTETPSDDTGNDTSKAEDTGDNLKVVVIVKCEGEVVMQLPINHCGEGVGPADSNKPLVRQALLDAISSLGS
jgi:hypothetical protein